jgi:inositol-phosphate transport system permease protein
MIEGMIEAWTRLVAAAPRPAALGRRWLGPLMCAPALALVTAFLVAPAALTLHISMTDMSLSTLGSVQWVGLENYRRLLSRPELPKIALNTLLFVGVNLVIFNLFLPLAVATLTAAWEERLGRLVRPLWLLPRVTPSVVYALLWVWLTAPAPHGTLNQLLAPLGVGGGSWLLSYPWPVVIVADGLVGTSFATILFSAAIRAVPRELWLAAAADGASYWQTFRYVVLPLLRWPIMFVATYQGLSLLASFEFVLLLTNGGPGLWQTEVWSLYAYHQAFSYYTGGLQMGYGAAIASLLVGFGAVASLVALRLFRFAELTAEPRLRAV